MRKILNLILFIGIVAVGCKKNPTLTPENPTPSTPPVATNELPAGAKDGVAFINNGTSAIITLFAPKKKSVAVIGEFNNWQATTNVMKNTSDGKIWWVQIDNLDPNKEYAYQFLVDGNLKIADPYCEKILDPDNDKYISSSTYPDLKTYPTGKTTGIVSAFQANQATYSWKNTSFSRPSKDKLVIYELLIRDFTTEHNYASTLAKLPYLKNLGINAIELMPVNEFEGNLSWGYNPSYYFAPDKYYGTKVALQNFIDECHQNGIAVILDMVLNHSFGQSPMVQLYFEGNKPTAENPWFNADAKHPYNVGFDFNHDSEATKYFTKNVIKYWMQQYKVDGFRFDLAKGFTQHFSNDDAGFSAYDFARIALWKEYNNYIKSIDNNNFYTILELFADKTEEQVYANEGMMMWNNLNYNTNEATMGYIAKSDFSYGFYTNHGFSKSENLISYGESHDEERLNFKNITYGNTAGSYSIKGNLATSLKRQEMQAAFLFAIPGPKMIWQFGELGYDISIDFNGRTGEKPIHPEYYNDQNRKSLYDVYAKFINLKKNNPIFNIQNPIYNLSGNIKHIKLSDATNTVVVVGNFDVVNQTANVDFGNAGTWIDAVGNPINLTSTFYQAILAPGEFHVFSKIALK